MVIQPRGAMASPRDTTPPRQPPKTQAEADNVPYKPPLQRPMVCAISSGIIILHPSYSPCVASTSLESRAAQKLQGVGKGVQGFISTSLIPRPKSVADMSSTPRRTADVSRRQTSA